MARSVRSPIGTRSARLQLSGRKEPYYQQLEKGLSAGYHRPLNGGAGTWWGRARTDGRYRVEAIPGFADDHQDADGERILNWAQAQAAVRAWAGKVTGGGPYTVAMAVADYVTDLRARKGANAAQRVEDRLDNHLTPALKDRRLAEVTAAELTTWRNGLVSTSDDEEKVRRSRDSANRVLGMLKAAFNLAFNTGKVTDDRAWRRVKTFRGVGAARKIILTDAGLQQLVEACESGLQELMMAGAWTGCRLNELTSARVRDFDGRMLRVRGKTGERELYLPTDAVAMLHRLAGDRRPDDYLFLTSTGSPWKPSMHTRRFAAAVAKTGLDPKTTFYALRHTFISRALVAGVPIRLVADHCGTSVVMIERHYAKFIPSDRERYASLAAPPLRITAAEQAERSRGPSWGV